MKNPETDYMFLVECENEDEDKDFNGDGTEDKDFENDENEDQDDVNDSSEYPDDGHHPLSKPGSFDSSWPQSYRKSMDLYSGVASPSINFLGSSLSSIGESFLSSSPKRRHTSKIVTSLDDPLLLPAADKQQPQKRYSSDHSLHRQLVSSAKTLPQHQKSQIRQSSFGQAVVNGVNLLCGVALLSTPYAVKEGGWVGLTILFMFCVLSFYTGILLRYCLDSQPGLKHTQILVRPPLA